MDDVPTAIQLMPMLGESGTPELPSLVSAISPLHRGLAHFPPAATPLSEAVRALPTAPGNPNLSIRWQAHGPPHTPTLLGRRWWPVPPDTPAPNQGIPPPVGPAIGATSFGQRASSCRGSRQLTGRKSETSANIVLGEFREIGKYLRNSHSTSKVFQYVAHGNPHSADARLPASLAWFDGNEMRQVHIRSLSTRWPEVNQAPSLSSLAPCRHANNLTKPAAESPLAAESDLMMPILIRSNNVMVVHLSAQRPLDCLIISPVSGSTTALCLPRLLYFFNSPCCVSSS